MIQEADLTLHKSSLEHFHGSKDRLGLFCEPKRVLFDSGEFSLFNDSVDDFTDLLGDDELFYHSRKSKRHLWDGNACL